MSDAITLYLPCKRILNILISFEYDVSTVSLATLNNEIWTKFTQVIAYNASCRGGLRGVSHATKGKGPLHFLKKHQFAVQDSGKDTSQYNKETASSNDFPSNVL